MFETLHRHIEFAVLTNNETKKMDEKTLEAYVSFVAEKTKNFEDSNPNIMSAGNLLFFCFRKKVLTNIMYIYNSMVVCVFWGKIIEPEFENFP